MSIVALLALAAFVLSLGFGLLWYRQTRTEDASLVDVAWAASLGGLAVYYAVVASGHPFRRAALALVVGAWSARLAWHIYARHQGGPEDGRYRDLRERWGEKAQLYFFFFFQAQAGLALVLSLPFLLVARNQAPTAEPLEIAALVLAVISVYGESVADRQLERHRRNPDNRGKTCRSGLWRYSRHPNYFFEWLIWCSFALGALAAPAGALGLTSPALMLFLILKVTGIPPTEERALQSRGEDYRRYQETTSAFVPWFPKEATS